MENEVYNRRRRRLILGLWLYREAHRRGHSVRSALACMVVFLTVNALFIGALLPYHMRNSASSTDTRNNLNVRCCESINFLYLLHFFFFFLSLAIVYPSSQTLTFYIFLFCVDIEKLAQLVRNFQPVDGFFLIFPLILKLLWILVIQNSKFINVCKFLWLLVCWKSVRKVLSIIWPLWKLSSFWKIACIQR